MNKLISSRLPRPLLLLGVTMGCVVVSSCSSSNNSAGQTGGGNSAYASYPSDGHYNPYPTSGQNTAPRYQEYTEAPPPPPPTTSASKPKASSTSSSNAMASNSTAKKTTKKKSTTASNTASTKTTSSGTVHVVKPKDSLWSIAKKYHTTVSKLKSANGLTSDLIRDGKKLKIP